MLVLRCGSKGSNCQTYDCTFNPDWKVAQAKDVCVSLVFDSSKVGNDTGLSTFRVQTSLMLKDAAVQYKVMTETTEFKSLSDAGSLRASLADNWHIILICGLVLLILTVLLVVGCNRSERMKRALVPGYAKRKAMEKEFKTVKRKSMAMKKQSLIMKEQQRARSLSGGAAVLNAVAE